MGAVMDGEATPAQLAALLVALRMRGETVEELAGFASAMRERVLRVEAPEGTIDVVGTGGDGSRHVQHLDRRGARRGLGRACRSRSTATARSPRESGSADVLEALGVRIDHTAESAAAALRRHGFAFLFAPNFHPAMQPRRPDAPRDRRADRVQPARAAHESRGSDARAARRGRSRPRPPRIAEVAALLGTERTLVVHGAGRRRAAARRQRRRSTTSSDGGDASAPRSTRRRSGLARAPTSALAGGDGRRRTPAMIEAIFAGEPGPRRDVVLLNAGAALRRRPASATDIADGIAAARNALDTGMPRDLLARLRDERPRPPRGRRDGRSCREPGVTLGRAARRARRRTPVDRRRRRGARGHAATGEVSSARSRRGDSPISGRRWTRSTAPTSARASPRRRRPRPFAARLAEPGLHLIAEIKRRSPSAGADRGERRRHRRPRPRLRGRRRGGDLGAVRAALVRRLGRGSRARSRARSACRSWPRSSSSTRASSTSLRAAGADAVLLLAVAASAPRASRGSSSGRSTSGSSRSSRRTTSASSSARSRRGARLIGINNRDLRTLDGRPRAGRAAARAASPTTGSSIAESGVRDAGDDPRLARARASMPRSSARRSFAPATRSAAARAFVAAGRRPADPVEAARAPVREDLRRSPTRRASQAAVRAGRGCDRAQPRARHAARPVSSTRPPRSPRSPRAHRPGAAGARDRRRSPSTAGRRT